jgi:sulfoxide reductase heme-binding subunit YedZ
LAIITAEDAVQTYHGGNLGYFFIIAMTATSLPSTAAWLGHRAWQILHTVGMYYLWLAFTYTFSLRLNESILIYTPFVGSLILAMILRLIAPKLRRRLKTENI